MDWEKDNFLAEFLCDTDQIDLESSYTDSLDCFPLFPTSADDASLSSYLSGEIFDDRDNASSRTSNAGKETSHGWKSPQCSLTASDDDYEINPSTSTQKQIIVVSRPSQEVQTKTKGDGNSKQAIAARQNRQKKKQYVSGLETSVQTLSEENETLKRQNSEQQQQIQMLKNEISYLKRVIANDSALSSVLSTILKNVNDTGSLKVSSSLFPYVDKTESKTDNNGQTNTPVIPLSVHTNKGQSQTCHIVSGQKRKLSHSSSSCTGAGNIADHLTLTSAQIVPAKQPCLSEPEMNKDLKHQQLVNVSQEKFTDHQFAALNQTAKGHASSGIAAGISSPDEENNAKQVDIDVVNNDDHCDFSGDGNLGGICLHPEHLMSNEVCSFCSLGAVKSCVTDHAYVKTSAKQITSIKLFTPRPQF